MSNLQIIDLEATSSAFGKINVGLKHAATDWLLSNSYAAGDVVNKDGIVYESNDIIPSSTAFVIGTVGATWKQRFRTDIDKRGWEMIHDNQYTQGVPFVVTNGQRSKITNNGGGVLTNNSQLPADVTELYNKTTDLIMPVDNLGDIFNYRITMTVKPSTANVVSTIEFQIEGDPVIVTGINTITYPDSSEREVHLYTSTFTLQNFIDNGASLYVSAAGGSVSIHNFKIFIERSYIGK